MAICPQHHESEWSDYCSVCGSTMAGPGGSTADAAQESCPTCWEPRDGPFCEECGHDFSAPDPGAGWVAVVTADREYFDSGAYVDRTLFPESAPTVEVPLIAPLIRIGRRSASRGITPEIDLSELGDMGVSREHAELRRIPDGRWAVRDRRSANGTYVNGRSQPITDDESVPLTDGAVIQLGLWSRITLRHRPGVPD